MRAAIIVASGITASLSLQWGNASLIEAIWTLTGLVGMYLTVGNLQDSRRYISSLRAMNDRDALRRASRIISYGHYRNELFRIWGFLVIIGIGIIAMISPPAAGHAPVTPVTVAITLGLFTLTGLMVTGSFLDRRQRDVILNIELDIEEEKDPFFN